MICRRCGNRIPEYLISREYFQCPECGRQFGNPPAENDRRGYEPHASRYERAEVGYDRRSTRYERAEREYDRRNSRYAAEYDDSPADDSYYDDGQGYYDDGYADDPYYDDQAYDDGYADDPYYDDQAYDDGYSDDLYYDDQDYSDDFGEPEVQRKRPKRAQKPKDEKRTMKLITLVYVLIAEIVVLIVMACIGAGIHGGEGDPNTFVVPATTDSATADPSATENPYPVV